MEHYFTNNENLKSEIRTLKYLYGNVSFSFSSDNGVFSKDKIDYGSHFLIDTFLKNKSSTIKSVLDVGCGYGFIGIVLSKILNINVDMIDVNKRALHLCEMNINLNRVNAKCFYSDCYEFVDKKYDVIITNPPIRAGKDIVLNILNGAFNHLNEDGTLWFVIRKDQGAKSIIKTLENDKLVEIVDKSKGFYVIKAKNNWQIVCLDLQL